MRRSAIGAAIATAALLVVPATPAFAAEVLVTGSGSGAQEVPAGSGEEGTTLESEFIIDTETGEITYTVMVTGNDEELTAGHIHRGVEGENGDVVVPLDTAAVVAGTEATATVEPELAQEIAENPEQFYANVHSPSFPPPTGNARAQLEAGTPTSVPAGDGSSALGSGQLLGLGLLVAGGGALALAAVRRRGHGGSAA